MVYIDDHLEALDWEAALPLLPDERRQKALRYRQESDRRQCVAAWLLLMRGCRELLGWEQLPRVAAAPQGKPYFVGHPDVHFNLSHCREAVACAIDTRPVGIDIERVRPAKDELVKYVCNEIERKHVSESDNPDLAFACLWTRKESMLKLTGEGLCDHLPQVLARAEGICFDTTIAPNARYVYTLATYKGS